MVFGKPATGQVDLDATVAGRNDKVEGGGDGVDTLDGGTGADQITDFVVLSEAGFGLSVVDASNFNSGAALGGVPNLLCAQATGVLGYDADGTGVAVTLATFDTPFALAAGDFPLV